MIYSNRQLNGRPGRFINSSIGTHKDDKNYASLLNNVSYDNTSWEIEQMGFFSLVSQSCHFCLQALFVSPIPLFMVYRRNLRFQVQLSVIIFVNSPICRVDPLFGMSWLEYAAFWSFLHSFWQPSMLLNISILGIVEVVLSCK